MSVHDPAFHEEIVNDDYAQRDDLHRLFGRILPKTITNGLGVEEDPLAYIVRHTQLLPRHVLATFNAILSRNFHATGTFRRVEEQAIRDGVAHVQRIIATQILDRYERIYPKLITMCREVLPDLNPICGYNELRKIEGRFRNRIEDDVVALWDTLFQVGVIGRVAGDGALRDTTEQLPERYCYGNFHFNMDAAFGMATDGSYCFHPVFSRAFGIVRRTADKRVVYPANVDMVTLS